MKNINTLKISLTSLVLVCSFISETVNAERIAITNATVHTVTSDGILNQATVIIDEGKIVAINPKNYKADKTIDAQGQILTPGFIASMNSLGLVEVGAVARTRDSSDKKADITFDASLAFNPKSSLIAYTRKGGITSSVVAPQGGESLFAGQTFVANLSGEFNSITVKQNAVLIHLGSKAKGSRALALQSLDNKLADAQKVLDKARKSEKKSKKDKKDKKEPKRDELVINALLAGEKPLLAYADRATDILALLALKKKYSLDLVLVGASDAVLVSAQIAAAKVPVITSAINNLPGSFDSLHGSLTNMATLIKAGVKVILTSNGGSHNLNQLRYDAGIAVANGLSKPEAMKTLTANVADVFKLNSGRIAVGKDADVVLWNADPFELSSHVVTMWINGKEVSTQSRQDKLRERYMKKSDMPRAYSK